MDDNEELEQSAVPLRAHLAGIEVIDAHEEKNPTTHPDYSVIVSVDEEDVVKSEKKSIPRWDWPEGHRFLFHPSSTIQIVIYRESNNRETKSIVGQHTCKIVELLENDEAIDFEDKTGAKIASKFKLNLSFIYEPEDNLESFMESVDTDVLRLESTLQAPRGILAFGKALQLSNTIVKFVANAYTTPILKTSLAVMSDVYGAIQQVELLNDTVQDLAENLREVLSIAREHPDLLLIESKTNVIEEIGRTSLKVASLIHEYTRPTFINSQLSNDINLYVEDCRKSCNDVKQKFDTHDQLVKEIREWLSAPDSSSNYHEAREKHQQDTCSWFLDGERFHELQDRADFLLIKGGAGCGKTILCSSIIHKMIGLKEEDGNVAYAYFFFDGRDSQEDLQHHDKFIRSLIWQLFLQCDGTPPALAELYGRGHQQPSTSSLEDVLQHIINGLPSAYIIIDSLDECTEREKTLRWINQIVSRKMDNLRVIVASRPEQDIIDVLQPLDARCIDLVNESANHDIAMYLERQTALVEKWDEETRVIIRSALTEHSQGMLRWVTLQLMNLKKCSNRRSVVKQLDNLPKDLYETCERILLKIDQEADRTDTKIFLRWLCFSVRPMELTEIAEAVTVQFDEDKNPRYSPAHRYWDERDVLKKCVGLITESYGRVKLAHFSIKEYLLSEHLRTGPTSRFHLISDEHSHSLMSQTCLAYLLQFNTLDSPHGDVATSFPLASYAAQYWISHAHAGGIDRSDSSATLTLAMRLFKREGAAFTNWVRIWDLDNPYDLPPKPKKVDIGPPLYYSSLAGLQQVSLHLLEQEDVNAQGGKCGSALQAASSSGHKEVVKLLLEKGADVNAHGGFYGDALQAGSASGNEEVVKLLLENAANVNALGGGYGSALQAASAKGHKEIVQLLLKKGAEVNAQGGTFGNALQVASAKSDQEIVKLLLEMGADVQTQGGIFGNALQAASWRGHKGIVGLLLESGANVNTQGGKYGNALQAASFNGEEAIIKLLLEKGAHVNAQGGEYGSALQAAAAQGHEEVVKLLLDKGAEVNAKEGHYGSAFQLASTGGHKGIAQLLLEKGADSDDLVQPLSR